MDILSTLYFRERRLSDDKEFKKRATNSKLHVYSIFSQRTQLIYELLNGGIMQKWLFSVVQEGRKQSKFKC